MNARIRLTRDRRQPVTVTGDPNSAYVRAMVADGWTATVTPLLTTGPAVRTEPAGGAR